MSEMSKFFPQLLSIKQLVVYIFFWLQFGFKIDIIDILLIINYKIVAILYIFDTLIPENRHKRIYNTI